MDDKESYGVIKFVYTIFTIPLYFVGMLSILSTVKSAISNGFMLFMNLKMGLSKALVCNASHSIFRIDKLLLLKNVFVKSLAIQE